MLYNTLRNPSQSNAKYMRSSATRRLPFAEPRAMKDKIFVVVQGFSKFFGLDINMRINQT